MNYSCLFLSSFNCKMFHTFISPFNSDIVYVKGSFTNEMEIPISELNCIELLNGIHTFVYIVNGLIKQCPTKLINPDGYHYIIIKNNKYDIEWLRQSFEAGDKDIYGVYYYHLNDFDKMFDYLIQYSNYGCVNSMFELGQLYYFRNEYDIASKFFIAAAKKGHRMACVFCKFNYAPPHNIVQITTDAYNGDIDAKNYLYNYYTHIENYTEANKWFVVENPITDDPIPYELMHAKMPLMPMQIDESLYAKLQPAI